MNSAGRARALGRALAAGLLAFASRVEAGIRAGTPEYFYQPSAGIMQLSFEGHQILSAATSTLNGSVKTNDVKIGDAGFGCDFGYGFSDEWAFTVGTTTDNFTLDYTDSATQAVTAYRRTGRGDITLMLSNITALGGWNLNIGVGAALSPGKRLDASSSSDGNNLTGATGIINYIGLSTGIGSGNFVGGKAQYITRTQGTANTNTTSPSDYAVSGGNSLAFAAFISTELAPFEADLTVSDQFIDPIIDTYAPGSTVSHDAYRVMRVEAGAQYALSAAVNLRVTYQVAMYGEQVSNGTTHLAAYSRNQAAARLRFEF